MASPVARVGLPVSWLDQIFISAEALHRDPGEFTAAQVRKSIEMMKGDGRKLVTLQDTQRLLNVVAALALLREHLRSLGI